MNTNGATYSHNSRKLAVGKFTANIRKAGFVWRREPSGYNVSWVYAERLKYNPRHLPVVMGTYNGGCYQSSLQQTRTTEV